MLKLKKAVENNFIKNTEKKNTVELLSAVRGGGSTGGWVNLHWSKSF